MIKFRHASSNMNTPTTRSLRKNLALAFTITATMTFGAITQASVMSDSSDDVEASVYCTHNGYKYAVVLESQECPDYIHPDDESPTDDSPGDDSSHDPDCVLGRIPVLV